MAYQNVHRLLPQDLHTNCSGNGLSTLNFCTETGVHVSRNIDMKAKKITNLKPAQIKKNVSNSVSLQPQIISAIYSQHVKNNLHPTSLRTIRPKKI